MLNPFFPVRKNFKFRLGWNWGLVVKFMEWADAAEWFFTNEDLPVEAPLFIEERCGDICYRKIRFFLFLGMPGGIRLQRERESLESRAWKTLIRVL